MPSFSSVLGRVVGLRITLILALILLLATVAQAYTLVLRGGRVVEIPDNFSVSAATLTYEVSPGIQVSLPLKAIDIAATEKANREVAGSFQARLVRPNEAGSTVRAANAKSAQERTVTNLDLESFARKRREAEVAYERRRRELGLPSAAEMREQAAADNASMKERFEQSQLEQRESEAYWRERSSALKAELAATDAEINSTRQQLDLLPPVSAFLAPGVVAFPGVARSRVNPSLFASNIPRVFVTPQIGPELRGGPRLVFSGPSVQSPVSISRGMRGRFSRAGGIFPGAFAVPYQSSDLSYERSVLVTRLNELVARRAGLAARWRALEDEARRAGALPGWLRP